MGIAMILDMAASATPDRLAMGGRVDGTTYRQLDEISWGGAGVLERLGARHVVFIGVNGPILPILMFATARAGVPLAPLNYRLPADQLRELINRLDEPIVVADDAYADKLAGTDHRIVTSAEFLAMARTAERATEDRSREDETAIVLFTSGTTSAPKGVVLRHRHLLSYLLNTVEFASASEENATLVSTPPYHIAGLGAVLSNIYAGRRMVHLPDFSPRKWLDLVREESVSSAMVVPTMLARIVEHLDGALANVPSLTSLAYGGARMPQPVLEKALDAFPGTGFVNAYGLTETSSTIAVLGPEDHREAYADPALRHRLSSTGRIVPGMEAQIRAEDDVTVLPDGETGLLWVRGAQVSGEYMGKGSVLDADGWFPTRDRGRIDDGFLYIGGRADDTIIRGGENIAPAEIEDVLVQHEQVREVAVVGLADDEWGERICAVIVPNGTDHDDSEAFRDWCRERLRGSRTPDDVVFVDELPRTPTGKIVRRDLVGRITAAA
ncbi:class I adenylate-forming enzyme family protein [Rhodococcus chondri]|uniref:Class I adenylate-forming enzyme family protein n=1 Tax=Rhodococcus chondri TaxID=3065941 RepID=A0ABU7JTG5_9NOCA|nr:class I adenylate-forming enzyme family protein [Rhodococcus sp. CC-R104]MEE2033204.1 class I adenylate-forming enzyme family protein [Rhodococcus sp. CC-R104]